MKKILMIFLIMMLFSLSAFGEMIDESYIDLIFNNFSVYDDETKLENAELLDIFFSSNIGLDMLYAEIVRSKQYSLKFYGITEEDLKRNIEALKTWSIADRKAILEYGVAGNREKVLEINSKYDDSSQVTIAEAFIKKEIPVKPDYENTFEDINSHWSKSYVEFLTERGIISGKSKESYAPNDNILKSEIVTLVMNLVIEDDTKLPEYTGEVKDIETGAWYDTHMQRAFALDVIKENAQHLLNPKTFSTREEVVDILIRTIEAMDITIDSDLKIYTGDFNDFNKLSDEYEESMIIAINLGFISGKGNGNIAPDDLITRGETAVVVKKLYEYILKQL